nr:phenylalanine--tRNA ligase subunit beta [Candidatus Omnitrophota bacterium]
KVAIANIEYASLRATALIKEIAGGVPGEFTESVGKVKDIRSVTLRLSRLNKLLGIYIPTSKVKGILTALGLKIGKSSKDSITLHVPDFRNDISSEVDCIEEVARAYGYGKVAGTIPGIVDQSERLERKRVIAKNIRATLAANGAFEIITYSLISRKAIESSRCALEHIAEVRNPLSGEQEVMRSTLLPGMLNAILWNINRKNKNLKLFELGNVYKKTGEDKFEEVESLSIAVTGEMVSGWQVPARPADFYDLKGIVEKVVEELGVAGITFKASDRPGLAKGVCADIFLSGGTIGFIGEVDHKVTHDFDVKDKIYFAQLTTGPLCEKSVLKKTFQAIPRYPSVSRDISVIVSKDIINLDLIGCINGAAGPLLKSVELVDRYKGKQISGDNISMTYRLEYQDPSRTLEEKDIQDVHARVLNALAARFGAKQR